MNYSGSHGVLKPQAEVLLPDPRWEVEHCLWQKSEPFTMADLYARLNLSKLHSGVPEKIQTQFETARNLLLYSWFVFEFQTVSEMHAFSTLEMALRMKHPNPTYTVQRNGKPVERRRMLRELLEWAVNQSLISPSKLPTWDFIKQNAISRHGPGAVMSDSEWIEAVAEIFPQFRNNLAHGSPRLELAASFRHLELCADMINVLYPPARTN
jgi:hypothetical protein